MKAFERPKFDVVFFQQDNIITASDCGCVSCTVCPDGKNDCSCYDLMGYYSDKNEW